jgi:hypothetical protein
VDFAADILYCAAQGPGWPATLAPAASGRWFDPNLRAGRHLSLEARRIDRRSTRLSLVALPTHNRRPMGNLHRLAEGRNQA